MILEEINLIDDIKTLEIEREAIQNSIIEAQSLLGSAKAKQKSTGEYADPNWFAEQRSIVRNGTIQLHEINRKIKSIRMQSNKYNPQAIFFQEAARQILSEDQYTTITDLATQNMNVSQ